MNTVVALKPSRLLFAIVNIEAFNIIFDKQIAPASSCKLIYHYIGMRLPNAQA